jgi:hypothetical protein
MACLARPHPAATSGAPGSSHWSFQPIVRPAVPDVQDGAWARNPIDAFVLARLEAQNAAPQPEADPAKLLRRVTLDLNGLPPTPDEVDAFLADPRPDAFESAVDRLLASPRLGETLAREWLDAARYGDSHGYHNDQESPMWAWRDWVIKAFNDGLSFDQFSSAQIAGDLTPDANDALRIASGFNRNHPITAECGVIDEEYTTEYAIDRAKTFSTVWLGLTLGCARCHDHKYDPFTQKDFYRLVDCFNQVGDQGDGEHDGFAPTLSAMGPLQRDRIAQLGLRISELDAALDPALISSEERAWESRANALPPATWTPQIPVRLRTVYGSTLAVSSDASIRASGDADADTYVIELASTSTAPIRALQIEALADSALPGGGPGRAMDGSFRINEVRAVVLGSEMKTPLVWGDASADGADGCCPPTRAIDGLGRTSWSAGGGNSRIVRLALESPVSLGPEAVLVLEIDMLELGAHTLGRFRVSTSSDPLADLPLGLEAALARSPLCAPRRTTPRSSTTICARARRTASALRHDRESFSRESGTRS